MATSFDSPLVFEPCDYAAIEREERPQAARLALYLKSAHPNPDLRMIDVGCGPGLYVEEMRKVGIDAIGVDNDPRAAGEHIRQIDIAEHVWAGPPFFDVAVSLEVGEHMPRENASDYVQFLESTGADVIYFSAARPGQGGHGHINLQPKSYWVRMLHSVRYYLDPDETAAWLGFMASGYHMGWLTQNGMVFRKAFHR